jgi:hypothetical protein
MNGMLRRRAYTLLASVLMLLTVLAAVAHSQDAAPAPLAPEEYAATVRAAATLLQSDPAALDAAQRQLVAVEQVELRSGEVVTVAPVLGDAGGDLDGVAAQARLQIVTQQLDAAGADATSARLALMETVLGQSGISEPGIVARPTAALAGESLSAVDWRHRTKRDPHPGQRNAGADRRLGRGRRRQRAPDCAAGALVADAAARLCRRCRQDGDG